MARPDRRLGGGEADRRARDDGRDLPGLRAGALRRLATVGDRRRDRRRRRTPARLRAVPARGAARLSLLDRRPLGDHGRGRSAHPRPPRPRRGDSASSRRSSAASSRCCWRSSAPGLFFLLWQTDSFTRWRSTLEHRRLGRRRRRSLVGVAIVLGAAAGHKSDAWYVATGFEKQRVFDYGLWSVAAMTIGLAVLPVVATVAAFASRRVRATVEGRAFVVVGVAACVAFVVYAAVKGAFLSTKFADLIVERNVIYLVPVVLAATAAVLARPLASMPALVAGFARRAVPRPPSRVPARPVPLLRGPEPRDRASSRTGTSAGTRPTSSGRSSSPRSSRSRFWRRARSSGRGRSGWRSPSSRRAG